MTVMVPLTTLPMLPANIMMLITLGRGQSLKLHMSQNASTPKDDGARTGGPATHTHTWAFVVVYADHLLLADFAPGCWLRRKTS